MPRASKVFPPALEAVGQARRFLRSTLAEWGCEQYDVGGATVVTELATNAALHARSSYEVRVGLADGHLVIEVADSNPLRPRRRGYDSQATTGRGMSLVSALSADWGSRNLDDGKVVWAHVLPDDVQRLPEWSDLTEDEQTSRARPPTLPPRRAAGSGTAYARTRAA